MESFRSYVRLGNPLRGAAPALLISVAALAPLASQADSGAPRPWPRPTSTFEASGLWRTMFGNNWRALWRDPIAAPVLDLGTFAGGLKPFKKGGNQSFTLHFEGADGRRYVFRSIEKTTGEAVRNDDLHNTPAERIVRDQGSAAMPAGAAIADVLATAVGVLHPTPILTILPDDPRLGEYRSTFAGLVGYFEIKPANWSDEAEPFAGASRIQDSDELLDALDRSLRNRVDASAYLTARLLDGLIGDFDRGADQWDWARYDTGETRVYRPIARDRDWAFTSSGGLLMGPVRQSYKKLGRFGPHFESIAHVAFMTHEFDRSHLVALARADWDSIVARMRSQLTREVIDSAVRVAPRMEAGIARQLAADLASRVDELPVLANEFFRMVNEQADVFAADERELAEIDRAADGSVRVRLNRCKDSGSCDGPPAFDRVFRPAETREIRVYLQENDDRAIVRGAARSSITVRVIGGGGDDQLVDSSIVGGGSTRFYDAAGKNTIIRGAGTVVDTRSYSMVQPGRLKHDDSTNAPKPSVKEERRGRFEDQQSSADQPIVQRLQFGEQLTWGRASAIGPVARLQRAEGVVVGLGYTKRAWGFRDNPLSSQLSANLLVGVMSRRLGVELRGEWYRANSPMSFALRASATGFGVSRFYGYGNESVLVGDSLALIHRDDIALQPLVRWSLAPRTSIGIGANVRHYSPAIVGGSPAEVDAPIGARDFGSAGVVVIAEHNSVDATHAPHRGVRASITAAAYPRVWDAKREFATTQAEAAGYVPIGKATIAMRIGGARAWGGFPLEDAAMIGGGKSLRGFSWNRFAGDAAVSASTELRVPVMRIAPFTRGDLGFILLADAGRVWFHGNSPGGWHSSYGGGLSFTSLGHAASVVYAHGEASRFYLYYGFPF